MAKESASEVPEKIKNIFTEGDFTLIKSLVLMFETEVSKDIHKKAFLQYIQNNPNTIGPSGEAIGHTLSKLRLLTDGEFAELVRPLHIADQALDNLQE